MDEVIQLDNLIKVIPDPSDRTKLHLAFQSFAKRNTYSGIYYREFLEKTDAGILRLERIDSGGHIRSRFEASAVAFVSNAHALIDSFPFMIWLVLKPLRYSKMEKGALKSVAVKAAECGWNDRFHEALVQTYPKFKRFARMFKTLMNNPDFVTLRKMSNNNKHKYLTRISNNNSLLRFELIDVDTGGVSLVDVKKLFIRLHNVLLPKIYGMYTELERISKP